MHADLLRQRVARSFRASPLLFVCATMLASAAAGQPAALNRIVFEAQPLAPAMLPAPDTSASYTPVTAMPPDLLPGADNSAADIESYLQRIAAIELDGGPFASDLLEQYLALGETHQQLNDHEAALAAFEKADYISRINNGLYAPDQFAIVENMIESHLARNEVVEAGNKQRYLLLLHEEQYGENSVELVPALEEIGDWNFSVFERQLAMPNTVFALNANTAGFGSSDGFSGFGGSGGLGGGRALSPRAMAFGSLYQSQISYWRAINIMLNNGRFQDPALRELEHKLIETAFLNSNRDGLLRNPDFFLNQRSTYTGTRIRRSQRPSSPSFFTGRSAYERLLAYHMLTPGTDAVTIAQTLIALGDWNLVFDRQATAIKNYESAHAFLVANAVPQATIDALLSPVMPQQLPTITALPHSRAKFGIAPDVELQWDGYADVSFRITRFGQAERFDIIGREGPLTKEMEGRLRRMIQSTPFRPRFADGEPRRGEEVQLRYYFAQLD